MYINPIRETVRRLIVALNRIAWLESEVARLSAPEHWYDRLVSQVDGEKCSFCLPVPIP